MHNSKRYPVKSSGLRLAILASGRGTNLSVIVNAIAEQELNATIVVVISNKADAGILQRAHQYGIKTQVFCSADKSRAEIDAQMLTFLQPLAIDVIVLLGYMRILTPQFVDQYKHRIINVHPSLLPLHAGKMDLAVHQAVLDAHETITGCTVHYVIAEVDAGEILVQLHTSVFDDDSSETLRARVQALEGRALVKALKILAAG